MRKIGDVRLELVMGFIVIMRKRIFGGKKTILKKFE